ncbi:MAG: DUF1080 domain-containing protein [Phycisphaerae bacterium]|nr:DUF1080 domain-containing protein [Phycisphaerae bacterium]
MWRAGVVLVCVGAVCVTWVSAEPGKDDGWIDLFNGESLSGWQAEGPGGTWVVKDGVIIGTQDEKGQPGDLMTRLQYEDFELELEFKVVWPANSGIWFRKAPGKMGCQFDILDYPDAKTGSIWSNGFKSKVADEKHLKKNDWNMAYIRCDGDHIVAKLNGQQVADFHDASFKKGAIGIQTHAGAEYKDMKIMVRRVRLRKLGKSADRPWLQQASNDYCNVCHVDFVGEELSITHLKQKITCTKCHGESVEHMQDEQGMTRADVKFGRAEVGPYCKTCHAEHKHPDKVKTFKAEWLGKTRPNGRPITDKSICTDCHGKHVVLKQTKRPGKAG